MDAEEFQVESDPDLLQLEKKLYDRGDNSGFSNGKTGNLVSAVNEVVRIFLRSSVPGEVVVRIGEEKSTLRVTVNNGDAQLEDVERLLDQKYLNLDEEDAGFGLLRARRLSDEFQVSSADENGITVSIAVRKQKTKQPRL